MIAPLRAHAGRLQELIAQSTGPLLVSVEFQRQYSGPPLAEGTQSVSFRVTIRAGDHTLSNDEIAAALGADMASLVPRHPEPELMQARRGGKNPGKARIDSHAFALERDRNIQDFAIGRHLALRPRIIARAIAAGKAAGRGPRRHPYRMGAAHDLYGLDFGTFLGPERSFNAIFLASADSKSGICCHWTRSGYFFSGK